MKKWISLLLVMMMALAFTACGGTAEKEESSAQSSAASSAEPEKKSSVNVDELKTFGDAMALDSDEYQSAILDNKTVVYVFKVDDTYYRISADIPEDMAAKAGELDVLDEDYQKKFNELMGPVEIAKLENLNEMILTDEEMDALVGKTGQELLDEGWNPSGYNLEDMEMWMNYGPHQYGVTLDGKVEEKDADTFDEYEDIKPMKVTKVRYMNIGDATNLE